MARKKTRRKTSKRKTSKRKPRRSAAQRRATAALVALNKARAKGRRKTSRKAPKRKSKKGSHHVLPHLPSYFRASRAPTIRPRATGHQHGSNYAEAKTIRLKPRSPTAHEFYD